MGAEGIDGFALAGIEPAEILEAAVEVYSRYAAIHAGLVDEGDLRRLAVMRRFQFLGLA